MYKTNGDAVDSQWAPTSDNAGSDGMRSGQMPQQFSNMMAEQGPPPNHMNMNMHGNMHGNNNYGGMPGGGGGNGYEAEQLPMDSLIDDDNDDMDDFGGQQQQHFSLSRQTSGAQGYGGAGPAVAGGGIGDGGDGYGGPLNMAAGAPSNMHHHIPNASLPGTGPGPGNGTSSWQHHLAQGGREGMQHPAMGGGGGMPRRNHSSDAVNFMRLNDPHQQQQQQNFGDPNGPLHSQHNASFPMPTGAAQRSTSMYAGAMDGAAAAAAVVTNAFDDDNMPPNEGFHGAGGDEGGFPGGGGGGDIGPGGPGGDPTRPRRSVSFAPSTHPGNRVVGVGLYDQHLPEHDGANVAAAAAAVAALDEENENAEHMLSAPYQNMMQQYNQDQFSGDDGVGRSAGVAGIGNMGGMNGMDDPMSRRPRGANAYQTKLPNPTPGEPAPPSSSSSQSVEEPPRPTAKWSRRCTSASRKQRTPDLQNGKQISTPEELQDLHKKWQDQLQQDGHNHVVEHVVDCAHCGVPLQVRKQCTMIMCSSCRKVSPAASCPVHRMESSTD